MTWSRFQRSPRSCFLLALGALLLVVWGCGESGEPVAEAPVDVSLETVVHPDLTTLSDAVRRQLEEQRSELDRLDALEGTSRRDLAAAYGRLGQLYHAYDFRQASFACYRNARGLEPDDPRWPYLLGMLHQAEGDADQAADAYRQVLEGQPEDTAAVLRLAEIELSAGRTDSAQGLFEQARGLDGGEAAADHGLGRIAAAAGDDTQAIERFERVLELQGDASTVHYLLAVAYRRAGDEAAAERNLAVMGNGEVEFPDPLADQIEGLGTGVGILAEAAIAELSAGNFDSAIAKYREAVDLEPESPTALRGLALALRTAGRHAESAEVLRQMLEVHPDHSLASMELATVLMEQGELDQALVYFDQVLTQDPDFTVARINRAVTLERAGRPGEAATEFRQVLASDPGNHRVRLNLAAIVARQGLLDEATTLLREAIRQQPRRADARQQLGGLLLQRGAFAEAEEQFRQLVELDGIPAPDRALGFYQLGQVATAQGDHEKAVGLFRQAQEQAPDLWQVRLGLGNALLRLGRFDEAAAEYRQAVAADATQPVARLYLAEALMRSSDWSAARTTLEEGLQAKPDSVEVAHALARLLAIAPDAQVRDGNRALDLASQIFQAHQTVDHAETVVMAMAEVGRFGEAVAWQEKLLPRAQQDGRPELLPRLQANLARYRQGLPARGN